MLNIEHTIDDLDQVTEYIKNVFIKINEYKEHVKTLLKPDVSLHELREIQGNHFHISVTLLGEYQRYILKYDEAKKNYKIWYAKKYSEVRKQLNPINLPGTKYAGQNEIEREVITLYTEEYEKHIDELNLRKSEQEFIRDLMNTWESVQMKTSSIQKSLLAELPSLHEMPVSRVRQR